MRDHLASFVEDFRRYGDQTALVKRRGLRRHSYSYREVADLSGRFAAELERRGIKKGDRVLIWGANGAEWIAAFFGCVLRGVLAVPLDAAGSADFAARVRNEVAPKLIVGDRLLGPGLPWIPFERFHQDLASTPDFGPVDGLSENDALQIVFTSGTTAEPKGIVHTHRNVLASLRPIEQEVQKYLKYERIFHPIRFLHTLPLSHVFGQFMGIWIPGLLAAEVHFESRLLAENLVTNIKSERISVVAAVPRVLELLRSHLLDRIPNLQGRLERLERRSVWRRWWTFRDVHRAFGFKFWAFVCGGATLPQEVERFWNTLGFAVIQGYGMTETAALVSLNHPFHASRGSIGKVLPGREVRLGDDGEILVRGDTVAQATWQGGVQSQRGSEWLATGDLASVDEAGNMTFRGRKKDVIVTAAGLNIFPEDLEGALERQPEVKACTVVEAEGPAGPEPLAVLVMKAAGDAQTAVRAANRELAEFQQIRRWAVWPEPDFPRTSTGKVMRREVARLLSSNRQVPGTVADVLGRITGQDAAKMEDTASLSEDLQLDSLGRVELQSTLEDQFGVDLDDAAYQKVTTLGELRQLLAQPHRAEAERSQEHGYPVWPWTWPVRWIRIAFIEAVMRPLVALLAKPRVLSALRADPVKPVLFVCNHVTAYDVPLLLYALPWRARHRVAVAMAGEMLLDWRHARGQGNPALNMLAPFAYYLVTALFNVFPLPQKSGFRESFAHAGKAMDRGYHVLVFPEGKRSSDGAIQPFQGGSGLLWKELGTDAVPVFLEGLGEVKRRGSGWFRSGELSVYVGAPIKLDENAEAAEAARVLEAAVRELRHN